MYLYRRYIMQQAGVVTRALRALKVLVNCAKKPVKRYFPVNFYTIVSLSLVINFAVRYSSNGITKYYASNYSTILDSGDTSIDYFKRGGKLRESESKDSRVKALIIS